MYELNKFVKVWHDFETERKFVYSLHDLTTKVLSDSLLFIIPIPDDDFIFSLRSFNKLYLLLS